MFLSQHLTFPVVNLSLQQCLTKLTMDQKQAVIPYSLIHPRENKNKQEFKKGKAVPLQAWSGPEGSRKLGFPDL